MLRGCFLSLLFLAALVGGYYYWFDQVFEAPGSMIAAGVVGFLVMCCLGAIFNARTAWSDWSRVATAGRDVMLIDGQMTAVSGKIHPVGEPLLAPFSRTPCVLCEYDLAGQKRLSADSDNTNSGSDYAGFLMVPSVIRSPVGDVRLLGFPLIEDFPEIRCNSLAAARNAREYLTSHEFEDRTGVKFVKVLAVFGEIWSDDDGLVQKNLRFGKVTLDELFPPELDEDLARLVQWQMEHPQEAHEKLVDETELGCDDDLDDEDLDDAEKSGDGPGQTAAIPKLVEKRVPVGEDVCAIGIYDEMRRGLVPPAGSGKPNRLLRGTAAQIERQLQGSFYLRLLGGLIGLLVIHGAILGAMQLYRISPDVLRDHQQAATQSVHQGNLDKLATLVRRGLDINFRDSEGRTLLMLTKDEAISAWLIEHGADVNAVDNMGETPLTTAARFGRTEIVKQLIAAGTKLNPRSQSTDRTPLAEAVSRGHEETADVLRQAGAQE